jgi:hypothetical protein
VLFGTVFVGLWFEEHACLASPRHKSRVVTHIARDSFHTMSLVRFDINQGIV